LSRRDPNHWWRWNQKAHASGNTIPVVLASLYTGSQYDPFLSKNIPHPRPFHVLKRRNAACDLNTTIIL
jgi:hypothetical protein